MSADASKKKFPTGSSSFLIRTVKEFGFWKKVFLDKFWPKLYFPKCGDLKNLLKDYLVLWKMDLGCSLKNDSRESNSCKKLRMSISKINVDNRERYLVTA